MLRNLFVLSCLFAIGACDSDKPDAKANVADVVKVDGKSVNVADVVKVDENGVNVAGAVKAGPDGVNVAGCPRACRQPQSRVPYPPSAATGRRFIADASSSVRAAAAAMAAASHAFSDATHPPR